MTHWKVVSPWKEGVGLDEEWLLDDSRSPLSDNDATLVSGYLRSGGLVFRNTNKICDPLAGSHEAIVPISLHTDGEWIWNEALLYFVEKYNYCPASDFMTYLQERNFEPRVPSTEEIADALAAVQGRP